MAKKKPKLTAEQRERIRQVKLALRPYAVGDKVRLRKDSYHYQHEGKAFNPKHNHVGAIIRVSTSNHEINGYDGFTLTVEFKHHESDGIYAPDVKVPHWVRPCDIERIK